MKKLISISMIIVLVFSLGACVRDAEEPTPNPPVVEDPTTSTDSKEVTLYFVNTEYVMTGNEDLEKLIEEVRVVEYGGTSLEEAIVRELIKGPENTEELSTLIPSTVTLIGVEVADGTASVNFGQEGLNGGSLQESMTISQIVESLGKLDTVDRVQFLIDGQKGEALMGHIEIGEPIEATKAE